MGISALLGTPLLNEGKLIGVLHVGTVSERRFSPEDAELLELAAGRLAGAVRAHALAGERDAAQLLERSLRPSALPVSLTWSSPPAISRPKGRLVVTGTTFSLCRRGNCGLSPVMWPAMGWLEP